HHDRPATPEAQCSLASFRRCSYFEKKSSLSAGSRASSAGFSSASSQGGSPGNSRAAGATVALLTLSSASSEPSSADGSSANSASLAAALSTRSPRRPSVPSFSSASSTYWAVVPGTDRLAKSLVTQGDHRIDLRCPHAGQQTGSHGHDQQHRNRPYICRKVCRAHSEQQRLHPSRQEPRRDHPRCCTHTRQTQPPPAKLSPSRTTDETTWRRSAPRAMRIPISRVCCETR